MTFDTVVSIVCNSAGDEIDDDIDKHTVFDRVTSFFSVIFNCN